MPVTRFDLAEFVGDAFRADGVHRSELVRIARDRGARPGVLNTLRQLPDRRYRQLGEIFAALPSVPDEADPWASAVSATNRPAAGRGAEKP